MLCVIIGERILERLDALNMSQTELARRVGLSQPSIYALIHRNKTGSKYLSAIARELRTTTAYLTGETDDPDEGAVPAPTVRDIAEHLDLVAIAEIDQDYGMGGSFSADYVEEKVHHFPRTWIESITPSPPQLLTIARGRGDSMDPTIRDRDMVIIDRSRTMLDEQDAIWALAVGQIGMIKRLRARGESIVIKSDNQLVGDEEVSGEEVTLVGRVVFVGRRI